jgi:hypothetical protein
MFRIRWRFALFALLVLTTTAGVAPVRSFRPAAERRGKLPVNVRGPVSVKPVIGPSIQAPRVMPPKVIPIKTTLRPVTVRGVSFHLPGQSRILTRQSLKPFVEAREQPTLVKMSRTLGDVHAAGLKRDWGQVGKHLDELPISKLTPAELVRTRQVLRFQARRLQHLEEVQGLLSGKKPLPSDPKVLDQTLTDLHEATNDPKLITAAEKLLAYRALRRGDVKTAAWLLGAECKVEDAPALLRDLRRTVGDEEAPVPRLASRSPPVEGRGRFFLRERLRLLVPLGGPEGTRPLVRESVTSDLPPLEDAATTETRISDRLRAKIESHAENHRQNASPYLLRVANYGREAAHLAGKASTGQASTNKSEASTNKSEQEVPDSDAVARGLGRALTPAERILVSEIRRRGKSVEQIVEILKRLDKAPSKP